ncbi:hypothetical protein IMZ31_23530 (plasmid) [Pontibacillus sp. ALD_SL1]|uniref:hypothetical protein n=1 Tax=Pontibacillus sp. ALD_SL1 TaxID=2777185 RepID=UPI001A961727|nr:hypothetical protein [Pontibacillus sp. ALD_SL1]QST02424.1 hypothetical protein IMZ31_23530 [Pontibacillus sp. ALD_SL1]
MSYPEPSPEQKRKMVQFFKRFTLDKVLEMKRQEKEEEAKQQNDSEQNPREKRYP